jgi:(d)CTP diphosphatase
MKKHLEVVAALIEREDGKVLLAQRMPHARFADQWEMPGGKVEEGETREEAIAREMKEELGITCEVGECLGSFDDEDATLHITVHLFSVRRWTGEIRNLECQDHVFVSPEKALTFDLAPVDVKMAEALWSSVAKKA